MHERVQFIALIKILEKCYLNSVLSDCISYKLTLYQLKIRALAEMVNHTKKHHRQQANIHFCQMTYNSWKKLKRYQQQQTDWNYPLTCQDKRCFVLLYQLLIKLTFQKLWIKDSDDVNHNNNQQHQQHQQQKEEDTKTYFCFKEIHVICHQTWSI